MLKMTVQKLARVLILGVCAPGILFAQEALMINSEHGFRVELVAEGLGVPWGMALADNNNLLVTERTGALKRVNRFSGKTRNIQGVPKVHAKGQGGLLDVKKTSAADPWIYFTYSKPIQGEGATALARAQLEGDTLSQWQDLVVTQSLGSGNRHYGSRIAFDGQGHVFFSVGDRGERDRAQDLGDHAGSILRLSLEGAVPADNPFVGKQKALPEIWSYGHRNPQGLAYDLETKRLWAIEHGPRGGDEINWSKPGLNYGWPMISYGKEYWAPISVGEATSKPGMEQPVTYYDPSIAPGSLLLYTGSAMPEWRGNLFSGALKLTHLNRVVLAENGEFVREERFLKNLRERIRALLQSPEGWIYLSTDSGKIMVLKPLK